LAPAHKRAARSRDGRIVLWLHLHVIILFSIVPAISKAAIVRRHQPRAQHQLEAELTDLYVAPASHFLFIINRVY
jgi:hypothetical protein